MTADSRPTPYVCGDPPMVVKPVAPPAGVPILNLATNESSLGAPEAALAAIRRRAEAPHRYPDPASTELRQAIADANGLDPARIICGNGSEELLDGIGRVYARPGDEILFSEYGFLQFPIVARRVGATAVTAAAPGLTANVDRLLAGVSPHTRVLFLANPDNPTGTYIGAEEVRRLRDALPARVVLVIDSAYCEYVDDPDYSDGLELVDGAENVIVTRTFSKAWGLAGLRVGWAYASAGIAAALNTMRGIGNVNAIAQAAAVAALSDPGHVARVREATSRVRQDFVAALAGLGIEAVPGAANFVLARFPAGERSNAQAASRHLIGDGIITRTCEDYGLDDYLRITIGTSGECDRVVESLSKLAG